MFYYKKSNQKPTNVQQKIEKKTYTTSYHFLSISLVMLVLKKVAPRWFPISQWAPAGQRLQRCHHGPEQIMGFCCIASRNEHYTDWFIGILILAYERIPI